MRTEKDPRFFTDRGITDEIWQGRPYAWWTPADTAPATEPFADTDRGQRTHVTKIVNQSPGWVIHRYPPAFEPPLPPVYPELRPLNPVKTQGPRTHWHGDGPAPDDLPEWATMPGERANWQDHIARHKGGDDHAGVNTDAVHSHQAMAKYVFSTTAKIDKVYEHDHDLAWKATAESDRPDKRSAHVVKRHAGIDQAGTHSHTVRIKDPDATMARRIDVHPLAAQAILDAEVVFFALEGCIKADAILSAGGAVFSVPSVSLWDCDELQEFCWAYLADKTVVIVNDADWVKNDSVRNQSMLCRTRLFRSGAAQGRGIYVAAPEPTLDGVDTKGVDDWLGAGGRLEDLRVISSTQPPGIHEWVEDRLRSIGQTIRRDRVDRDHWLLWALSNFTGTDGVLRAPLKTVARVLDKSPMQVSRSIRSLEDMGALTVDGDLSTKRDWFSRNDEWIKRPTITLIPELRSKDQDYPLGELVQLSLTTPRGGLANVS